MSMKTNLDTQAIQKGLHFMLENDARPALCIVTSNTMRMVIAHDAGLMLSWEYTLPQEVEVPQAFAIPVSIAKMLNSGVLTDVDTVSLETRGKEIRLHLQSDDSTSELRWQWGPSALDTLGAPPDLEPMLALPPHSAEVNLEELSAIILQAFSQAFSQAHALNIAQDDAYDSFIAIAPVAPTVSVGGQYLGQTGQAVAYFNLHALALAVELVGGANEYVRVHVNTSGEPFLIIAAERAEGRVQCTIKAKTNITQNGTNPTQHDIETLPAWQQTQQTTANKPSKDPVPLEPSQLHNISRQSRPLDAMRMELLDKLDTPPSDLEPDVA